MVIIVEALVYHVIVEDVEIAKAGQYGGICHKAAPLEAGTIADFDFAIELGWDNRSMGKSGSGELLVEPGGEQKKIRILEGKAIAPLGDAAFAKDETLPTVAKGLANEGPFFKCHAHKNGVHSLHDFVQQGKYSQL